MGDGGLAHAEGFLQFADGELFSRKEGAEYAHPGEVADHPQQLARLSYILLGWHGKESILSPLRVLSLVL